MSLDVNFPRDGQPTTVFDEILVAARQHDGAKIRRLQALCQEKRSYSNNFWDWVEPGRELENPVAQLAFDGDYDAVVFLIDYYNTEDEVLGERTQSTDIVFLEQIIMGAFFGGHQEEFFDLLDREFSHIRSPHDVYGAAACGAARRGDADEVDSIALQAQNFRVRSEVVYCQALFGYGATGAVDEVFKVMKKVSFNGLLSPLVVESRASAYMFAIYGALSVGDLQAVAALESGVPCARSVMTKPIKKKIFSWLGLLDQDTSILDWPVAYWAARSGVHSLAEHFLKAGALPSELVSGTMKIDSRSEYLNTLISIDRAVVGFLERSSISFDVFPNCDAWKVGGEAYYRDLYKGSVQNALPCGVREKLAQINRTVLYLKNRFDLNADLLQVLCVSKYQSLRTLMVAVTLCGSVGKVAGLSGNQLAQDLSFLPDDLWNKILKIMVPELSITRADFAIVTHVVMRGWLLRSLASVFSKPLPWQPRAESWFGVGEHAARIQFRKQVEDTNTFQEIQDVVKVEVDREQARGEQFSSTVELVEGEETDLMSQSYKALIAEWGMRVRTRPVPESKETVVTEPQKLKFVQELRATLKGSQEYEAEAITLSPSAA